LALRHGAEAARRAVLATLNPLDAPAKVAAALDALGNGSLEAFQEAAGIAVSDTPTVETQIALLAALRALGPESPVQAPDGEAVLDGLVRSAGQGPAAQALARLRAGEMFGPPEEGM
ncbi:MAG: hypothetical protein ACR2RE_27790, partial [Geminicoccaceae bacterium]